MKLTRRDAVAALGTLGVGTATAFGIQDAPSDADGVSSASVGVRETFVAVAEVVYPSAVSGTEQFVDSFLAGRLDREPHASEVTATVEILNELANEWHDDSVPALAPDERNQFLREVGAHTAEEKPDGTTAERVRYYVVNELLLALYASPKGGELVGIENPQGHPGGTDTYQRGPQ